MLGWWLWLLLGVVGIGLLRLFATKRGDKQLVRWRKKLWKRAVRISREAIAARRRDTPRRRRRQARREQPHRLTAGHRRPKDDPPALRRLAGSVVEEVRTAAANRKAERRPARQVVLDWARGLRKDWVPGLCGSTDTVDGTPCRNRRMIGKSHCRFHPPTLNQMLLNK